MKEGFNMIYVCGDVHGDYDIGKLEYLKSLDILTEDDYLIICGDFGGVWSRPESVYYEEEERLRNWYASNKWTTLFVDGNHENFPLLYTYPVEEWNGGKIHKINDKLFHLMRGEVFTIEGKTIFTMGGAESHHKMVRTEGLDWWPQELPNHYEEGYALRTLDKYEWDVDYVISHAQPETFYRNCFPNDVSFTTNSLVKFFDLINRTLNFKHWYCGHLHVDKTIGDITCLYDKIIPLGSIITE